MSQPIGATIRGTLHTFTSTGALHNAIKLQHAQPVRHDGSPFEVTYLPPPLDGFLLDGLPINVWMDGNWIPGQKEALAKLWNSGLTRPDPGLWSQSRNLPTTSNFMKYLPYVVGFFLLKKFFL